MPRPLVVALLSAPVIGVLAGVSSWVFIEGLDWATDTRSAHRELVWTLPLAGLALGLVNRYVAGRAVEGTALVVREANEPAHGVPRRMWGIALGGTVFGHLFGGAVGREGTAVQMSGSLTDAVLGRFVSNADARRAVLTVAIGAGFAAVFGVPWAGAVFALEVVKHRRARLVAVVPLVLAAHLGDRITGALGARHAHYDIAPEIDLRFVFAVVVTGLGGGAVAFGFVLALRAVRQWAAARIGWAPLRPALGGAVTLALVGVFGYAYIGLSLPLLERALAGDALSGWTFAQKALFTVVSLAFGFIGGEVTPLFVVGATLGSTLATPLGVDRASLAAVGVATVFAAAARVPLAMSVLAVELFGWRFFAPALLSSAVAALVSSRRGLYQSHHHPDQSR